MSRFERSIKYALDKTSGKILEAEKFFDKTNNPYERRTEYHSDKLDLLCLECGQDLIISSSKFDRFHFKHKPNHDPCILSDGNLMPEEQDMFNKILIAKESERHIELKTKIGTLLREVDGVDTSTISIDDKFIIIGDEKRRPDVYCKYKDKELVFEIQLSNLSLRYILSRYEFYKKHKMYLIWILDNFDIHNQGVLEKDIKKLSEHENFFKLDEDSTSFKLECEYKFPFLTYENHLHSKWLKKSVALSELKFDSTIFQAYFYNFGDNNEKRELEQEIKNDEIKTHKKKILEELRLQQAEKTAHKIINTIKELREKDNSCYINIKNQIDNLNPFALEIFNSALDLKSKETPVIKWIKSAKSKDWKFLDFIITCKRIDKDLNEKGQDEKTTFQTLIENENLENYHKESLLKSLLEFNYKLNSIDEEILSEFLQNPERYFLYKTCNQLTNRTLIPQVFKHPQVLYIIESAKRQKVIGYAYKTKKWIQIANLAIDNYKDYWDYIVLAFSHFNTWEQIKEEDTKGTFLKKFQNVYLATQNQNLELEELIKELYPEIFTEKEGKEGTSQ